MTNLEQIYHKVATDPANRELAACGYQPVYTASEQSKIFIVGQAPGRKAQESSRPWNDASGIRLRSWLGVTNEQFYNPNLFALVPMDFYYPGKGLHGDLPPRSGFAAKWHPQILGEMPNVKLIIPIGKYAQRYYLGKSAKPNLTQTVHAYREYLPTYLPLVHPSPLNFRWQTLNPWFESDLVPDLRRIVARLLV